MVQFLLFFNQIDQKGVIKAPPPRINQTGHAEERQGHAHAQIEAGKVTQRQVCVRKLGSDVAVASESTHAEEATHNHLSSPPVGWSFNDDRKGRAETSLCADAEVGLGELCI